MEISSPSNSNHSRYGTCDIIIIDNCALILFYEVQAALP